MLWLSLPFDRIHYTTTLNDGFTPNHDHVDLVHCVSHRRVQDNIARYSSSGQKLVCSHSQSVWASLDHIYRDTSPFAMRKRKCIDRRMGGELGRQVSTTNGTVSHFHR
ncbi:hypothetical protein M408DRAFT_274511 [Serendipita vermifera MAFF 305830]|uniref:Uncharacterized protein n=1 Tax=Serendipita vermifera MAFF 305830 TaxID=933852 RepID=A0A0C3B2I4_SERVB|nr:hypothetical protein M408DRAFT_274511 [Serendipita vermifera MAFF 305830]